MKIVDIHNSSHPLKTGIQAKYCKSFFCQLRGFMFRRDLAPEEGLLFVQNRENRVESAIHMLFMFIDLAVVWVNERYQVVDVKHARRWRPVYVPQSPAKYVLELPIERINDINIGDQLLFDETNFN